MILVRILNAHVTVSDSLLNNLIKLKILKLFLSTEAKRF